MSRFALTLIQGILIGSGAILPGISGASLAVVFGVYEDFMDLIAPPFRNFRAFVRRNAALCVGIAVGFVSFTLLLSRLFGAHTVLLVFFFSGLIAGTLPEIFFRAREGDWTGRIVAFCVTAGVLAALALTHHATGGLFSTPQPGLTSTNPGILVWSGAGAIVGIGSLLPGISASFILIYLGLYGPLLDAVGKLEIHTLFALGLGALASVVVFSHAIAALYQRFHGIMTFAVLGFTVGSLLLVFPGFPEGMNAITYALSAVAGFAVTFFLARVQA